MFLLDFELFLRPLPNRTYSSKMRKHFNVIERFIKGHIKKLKSKVFSTSIETLTKHYIPDYEPATPYFERILK